MPEILPAIADARARMDAMLTKKAWEDDEFRRRFVADPKGMLAEFLGQKVPDSLSVSVHEEAPGNLHFVIPAKPPSDALQELSDAELERIAGGTLLEGVVLVASLTAWALSGAMVSASAVSAVSAASVVGTTVSVGVTLGTGKWG